MSVIARLEVIPQSEGSMSEAVARAVEALDDFDVSYETTPTDTIIEAEDPTEVFAAAEAAHRAADGDRLITSLEVDDQRTRARSGRERVESVERRLGRPAKRRRQVRTSEPTAAEGATAGPPGAGERPEAAGRTEGGGRPQPTDRTQAQAPERPQRYGGPWRAGEAGAGRTPTRTSSRYLQTRGPTSR